MTAVVADHAVTVGDLVAGFAVVAGVLVAIVALVGLLALAAKGWDH